MLYTNFNREEAGNLSDYIYSVTWIPILKSLDIWELQWVPPAADLSLLNWDQQKI